MSIVDHFDKAPEGGFSREWDSEAARRQLNVSLGLIAALAFAVGLVAFSMRVGPHRPVQHAAIEHVDAGSPIFGALARP